MPVIGKACPTTSYLFTDMEELNSLNTISTLDGRYRTKVKEAADYFSEFALFRYRILVEIEYIISLSKDTKVIRKITRNEELYLRSLVGKFSLPDAREIKQTEEKIRHDIKAVEYFLKEKVKNSVMSDLTEMIHFGLTSDDVNNLAYGLALDAFMKEVYLPSLSKLVSTIKALAREYAGQPMLARTHGQPALPTTFGKEVAVFYQRIKTEQEMLKKLKIRGKLNGAVGNFNAHKLVFPKIDWISFSTNFVSSLGLEPDPVTTQIESYDSYIRVFDSVKRINIIVIGLCQDFWRYISDDYLKQKIIKEEVGSSTMPQKVNPINFENAEGNLGLANALFKFYGDKLPVSRLQRDLSDSPVRRTFGEALAFTILSYKNIIEGLEKVTVNGQKMEEELMSHWEIITEGFQTVLRFESHPGAYEGLKQFARGKNLTKKILDKFIAKQTLRKDSKEKLKNLTPLNYIGLAEEITKKY